MKIFKKLSQKLREKIRNKNSNALEANEDAMNIVNTERQRRNRRIKKKVKSTISVFLFCFLAICGIYKNVTEVKATDFASKVVQIGGPITLQGNYTVTVWRSGNTVYCKAHVYVAAPNGAWSAMGAQVSANKGSASNTFVGNGSATPKAGSGDVQFSFNDAGAGTISGTIYAGFMPNLNGSQALTATFSVNYSSNTVDTHTVTYDTNGGYYKEPYKNSEGRIIIPDGNYTLQHVWSKKEKNLNQYMTIKDGNMGSGTGMVITKNDPSSAQSQWTFERYKDTSYYYIINVKSGKAISLYGNPKEGSLRNQAVEMYNQTLNYDDFLWYIREDGAGEYYIINKHTRQGLTARYTTVGDGNGVFQYGEGNDTSENTIYGDSTWYFNKVGEEVRTKAYGATFFTKSNTPIRPGYTFKYWSSSKDFATTWDGKNWNFNSTILDRAYIRAIGHNKYEVLAHTNGSIGEVSAPTWTMDGDQSDIVWYKLYPGTWERDGHTYNWGVQVTHKGEFAATPLVTHFYSYYSNGSGQAAAREYGRVPRVFMSEGDYLYDQNGGSATLYANWVPKTVKTTFHRNFNSSDTTTSIHTYTAGAGQSFSTNGWTRQGYTLLGWSHSPNATTATYTPTNGIGDGWIEAYSNSTDLYAVWKKNSYQQTVRVRFENADGSFGEYSQAYQANHDYGSTFNWEFPTSQQYQSAKVSYTITGAKSTDVTVYRQKYALAITGDDGVDSISGTGSFRYGSTASVSYKLKTGYKFVKSTGTTSDGNQNGSWTGLAGKEGTIQDTWSITRNRNIKLSTELINYSISYNLSGGSMSGQKTSYNVNTSTFTLPIPTKTGYTFTGWTGSNGSATQKSVTIAKGSTGDKSYTANWSANTYYVTYDANGGSNAPAQQSFVFNSGAKISTTKPTRTGYTFINWVYEGIKFNPGDAIPSGWGSFTLKAQWKANNYTYNIKYVSSSGKALGNDTVTGTFDTSKTVTPPAKTGYTTPAAQTVKFDSTSAKTITFTYQLINYTISYDVNGGNALSGQRTSYNIESSAYTLPVTSRTGYTFTGWTGSNGTTPQKSVTIAAGSTGNKSYKANWSANSLTVRYHSNGAFGGNKYENNSWKNDIVFDYGQSTDIVVYIQNLEEGTSNNGLKQYGLSDYDGKMNDHVYLYKNGYIGTSKYNTKQDGSGIEIDENKTFNSVIELANYLGTSIDSKDNSVDLYPQWKAISYSIIYNGNGATSGSMTEQAATFDKNINLTSNNFSRKYTVTYNAMGGTVNAPNNVATSTFNGWEDRGNITFMDKNYTYNDFDAPYYSQHYTDLNAAFGFNKYNLVKHYVQFGQSEGRNTKDNAGNAGLYPNKATVKNMTITNGYKVNLYANWKLGSVTLPTPTRFGYKFLGWYTSAEGGTKITGATYTPTSNVTLYAHWKLDSYYIDYNVNDTGLTDRITDNLPDNNGSLPGKDTAVMLTDFALQNGSKYNTKYTFKEWNTKPDGSGKKFTTSITNDGSLCKPGETLTLYAIWDTTPTITGKNFYMLENMKVASDILTSGKGLDKNPIDHFPDNMKDVAYPVKGYTKNGTDISSKINVDYVEFDGSKAATASIDTNKPGKYTVHYSLTDGKQTKKFTRTITVLSASTPVINAGDRYFNKGSFVTAEMLLSTVTSGDRYDGDLTTKVAVLNMENVAFNTVGSYDIQYKVTNRSGKTVVKKVKIHILEYLTDNQADKDNKYRYIRKDCSTKNDYCMEYFKEDSKWITNDELNNQIIDSLSKDKSEEAIKKYHFGQDDVERFKQ